MIFNVELNHNSIFKISQIPDFFKNDKTATIGNGLQFKVLGFIIKNPTDIEQRPSSCELFIFSLHRWQVPTAT